ncbi:MAG: ISKra4 family transposase [Armatimonadota bacterium]|nr:ISKra4 family transposase [Armatimonadota bacterium]
MEVPDTAFDDLPEWLQKLTVATAMEMQQVLSDEQISAAQSEEQVLEVVRGMGREALGEGLSQRHGRHQGPRRCPGCGQMQRFEGYREKTLVTLLGPVQYRRAYYRCPNCGDSHYQGDEAVGLDQGSYSLPAQEAVSLVCCELPFEAARQILGRLTAVDISSSHAQLITGRHGWELEQRAEVEREALFAGELEVVAEGKPDRLYVTLDGLKMPFMDNWHETKIGSVYDAEGGEDGIDQPRRTSYVCGAWEAAEPFGERLYQEAAHRGVEGTEELVAIADGAEWTWNLVEEHFPRAVQILDFYHAVERLHEVGRAVYGEGTDRAREWAEANKGRLWEGQVVDVLRSLRGLRPDSDEGREAVRLAIGYYQHNRRRMDYPAYRAQGYHVGSGVVEAACKTVAAARCKRSGMRWSKSGAQSVLALRCHRLNGRWDQYWKPLKAAS